MVNSSLTLRLRASIFAPPVGELMSTIRTAYAHDMARLNAFATVPRPPMTRRPHAGADQAFDPEPD
jgi:hypothetical protein